MTITLDQQQEAAVLAAIRAGMFRSADEFIDAAIASLPRAHSASASPGNPRRSGLWELRQGVSLGGLSIEELIDEGRE